MTKKIISLLSILILTLTISCSKDKEEENKVFKKKPVPINASERARASVEKEGGLQDALFGKKGGNNTFDFATSNSLWRASIELLKEIPLSNADYSGGVIVTDWYTKDGKESIKINITFSSSELAISSFNVSSFKKICNNIAECSVQKMETGFSSTLKNKIISKAREIELQKLNEKEKKK